MINLEAWQPIKVNDKVAYFQFFARSNGKDYAVVTFEPKKSDKTYYEYSSVEIKDINYF